MTVAVLLALAALQGLTEFLPVSSSGHLALAHRLLGFDEPPVLFDVSLHVGTVAAVLVLYRREALGVLTAAGRWTARLLRPDARPRSLAPADDAETDALGIVLCTAVTGALALPLADRVQQAASSPTALGVFFVAGGLILAATALRRTRGAATTNRQGNGAGTVTLGHAALIGVAQALAVLPGISRAGTTIAAALFLGVERSAAARFSFLASVPVILGAEVAGSLGGLSGGGLPAWQHVAGAAAAGLVGFAALATFVGIVRRGGLHWFAGYLIPLGIAVAVLLR